MINNKYPTTKPSLNLDFANTKSLDPRITFRRGTPGTYYDGVTHVKAEENLLKHSENFTDSLWSKLGTSLETTTEIAPDGSQNAYFLKQNSANSQHVIYARDLTDLGKTYSISIYAKAGAVSRVLLSSVFNAEHVLYDLSNGESQEYINASDYVVSYDMTHVGNGWYRCSLVYVNPISTNGIGFYLLDDNDENTFIGDNSSGVYIWGAQLEQRDSVTAYTATNGTPITKYQPKLMTAAADRARFDHDPITGESKGLLIEEQRTNLVQDSEFIEDISANGVWWNQSATVSSVEKNQAISPTGELNATKIIYNTNVTSGGLLMKYNPAVSVGDVLTASVYLKAGNLDKVKLFFNARSSSGTSIASPSVIVDLSLGVIESTVDSAGMTISDSSIHNVGNDWYRVTMTSTVITGVAVAGLIINMSGGPTNTTTAYDHFFVWGAQIEKASFATSYIKSSGATAGTVRSADNASITGENFSSWYRQDEGSLYVENSTFDTRSGSARIQFTDGTVENRMYTANGAYTLYVQTDDVIQVNLSSSLVTNQYVKKAIGLKENDFAVSIDGGDPLVDTSGRLPFVNKFGFWNNIVNSGQVNGHVKKLAYYPQRLTNEQLQNLTK